MRVRVRRCTGRLSNQAGGLLPRAGVIVWCLEVGFWGRLDPRLFPVASENSAFWATAVGAGLRFCAPFGHTLQATFFQGSNDRCAGVVRRGGSGHSRGLGTVRRRLERESVRGVLI